MLARIKSWLAMLGAVLLVLVGAYAAGGRAARRSAELTQAKRERQVQEKINAADEKLIKMADSDIRRELAGFVRKR